MLTEIEWWGGLIFVLGAITYKLVMGALETKEEGIHWYRWLMHAFFVLPAVVLAAYFYPLQALWLQYAYLGVLGASLLIVAAMLVQEITGDGPDEVAAKKNEATSELTRREGEEATKKTPQTDGEAAEEETGWLVTVLGALVLYSPVLAACGLGCYKAWPMVSALV